MESVESKYMDNRSVKKITLMEKYKYEGCMIKEWSLKLWFGESNKVNRTVPKISVCMFATQNLISSFQFLPALPYLHTPDRPGKNLRSLRGKKNAES